MVTGLQSKFDWAGVAAAGLASGAGQALGGVKGFSRLDPFTQRLAASMAGGIANAASRSLINGTDFGDNLMAALPDTLGQTIGNMLADGIAAGAAPRAASTGGMGVPSGPLGALMLGGASLISAAQPRNPSLSAEEIVVTGIRKHGFLWQVADFFGLHNQSLITSFDPERLARDVAMSVGRSRPVQFASGVAHGVYNVGKGVVTGLYHLVTTDPRTTARAALYGVAGAIDRVIAAEDTPAIVQLRRAGTTISHASAYDIGYAVGNVGANATMLIAPELAASRASFAGKAGALGTRAAERAIPEASIVARGPTGEVYSVAYEMKLNPTSYPDVSRGAHFQEANEAFLQAMEGDAVFAQDMQSLGISFERTPTGLAPRTSPSGWAWHHAEDPGMMQLVPRSQHQPGSIFQDALHPNGVGGYSIWGK